MGLSVTASGCARSSLSVASPNAVAAVSPTPPSNENREEPPPPEPLSPKPAPSLNPNSSDLDVELINAVKSENADEVKRFLADGANPNSFLKISDGLSLNYYETVLGLAVDKKNTDIARLLLDKEANVDKHSFDGNNPPILWEDNFSKATNNEDVKTMKLLVDHHADLTGNKDNPPIITKVKNIEVLDFLVKHGFDINDRDYEGINILIEAVFDNNVELVKAILKYNPDLNQKTEELVFTDYKKLTPLQIAEIYGYKEIIRELKKAGAKQ